MNCWDILEIDATTDKKVIKKAYAQKLKKLNVDENPQEFQQLKEALERALKNQDVVVTNYQESLEVWSEDDNEYELLNIDEDNEQNNEYQQELIARFKQHQETIPKSNVETLRKNLLSFFEEQAFFDDLEGWQKLFANRLEWSIEEEREIQKFVLTFVLDNYSVLSKRVNVYLYEMFDFKEADKIVWDKDLYNIYLDDYSRLPNFSFEIYREIEKDKRIAYFGARNELCKNIALGNSDEAKFQNIFNYCRSITENDADVLNLAVERIFWADFHLKNENNRMEVSKLFKLLAKLEENETTAFLKAYFYFVKIYDSKKILSMVETENLLIPSEEIYQLLIGAVYLNNKEMKLAKHYLTPLCLKYGKSMFSIFEINQLVDELPEKTKEQSRSRFKSWLGGLVLVCAVIGLSIPLANLQPKSQPKYKRYVNTVDYDLNNTKTFLDLQKKQQLEYIKANESLNWRFLINFYCEEDYRDSFAGENLSGEALEIAQTLNRTEIPQMTLGEIYSLRSKYASLEREEDYVLIYKKESTEIFLILQFDEDGKIADVFGPNWTVLAPEKEQALKASLEEKIVIPE